MRITEHGNDGIGTTTPAFKLDIEGDIRLSNNRSIYFSSPHDASPVKVLSFNNSNDLEVRSDYDTSSHVYFFTGSASVPRMQINSNGNVGIGTGTMNPTYTLQVAGDIAYTGNIYDVSDIRFKENITPLENAVAKVSSIRGIYFNNLGESPEEREVGVIAQEVETVLPEVVSEDAEGYKSVDYSKLTPLLVEAIKELKKENEELRVRIEALETERNY